MNDAFLQMTRAKLDETAWTVDGGTIVHRSRRLLLGINSELGNLERLRKQLLRIGCSLERGEEDPHSIYAVEYQITGPDGKDLT